MFLLDTNICIYLIKKQPLSVLEKLMEKTPSEVGISSITVAELEY
ncbi:MAG: PIN domain-containing protein, partial [Fidelibacterota bacterium]